MAAPTLTTSMEMNELRKEQRFTYRMLSIYTFTQPLALAFDPLESQWVIVNNQDLELQLHVEDAGVEVVRSDNALDDFVAKVAAALMLATGNDRNYPLYLTLFGGDAPSKFARPRLGPQLQTMKSWFGPLQAASFPAVVQLAPELPPLLAAGDAAAATYLQAQDNLDTFRDYGPKKAYVDQLNGVRQTVFGTLKTMPHAHPDLALPLQFADRFFKHDTSGAPKSAADIERRLDAARTAVKRLEKQLGEAEKREADKAKAAADKQAAANQQDIDEAQKQFDEAAARLAKLKGEAPKPPTIPPSP